MANGEGEDVWKQEGHHSIVRGLIVIVVRSDLCFQERARSRIGGSPEEALHDRGVFSGHYDERCGPGACQGIPATYDLWQTTISHEKTSAKVKNHPNIQSLFLSLSLSIYLSILCVAARASYFLVVPFFFSLGFLRGYLLDHVRSYVDRSTYIIDVWHGCLYMLLCVESVHKS